MKNILYLHGAGASPLSFRFIQSSFEPHSSISVQMSPKESVDDIIKRVSALCVDIPNLTIIAHSLGGLVGVGLLHLPNVDKIITISSPFGGHPAALIMSAWSQDAMFKDLSPYGDTIRNLQRKWTAANKPHLAIVTVNGLPIIRHDNDGVVTVSSQKALIGPKYEILKLNHFEVLMSDDTINLIKEFIWGGGKTHTSLGVG